MTLDQVSIDAVSLGLLLVAAVIDWRMAGLVFGLLLILKGTGVLP